MKSRLHQIASLVLLAALIVLPVGTVQAQAAIRLSQLTIRLWPEYDKPGVLVFLIGQTAQATPLPATLTITLPKGAQVNAVAYVDKNNVLTDQVEKKVEGDKVTISTPTGNFHIEFYDSTLTATGKTRAYEYTWNQPYGVDALTWDVQQPVGAVNFKIEPPGGATTLDDAGLTTYQVKVTGVEAGQDAKATVSYEKDSPELSVTLLQAQQAAGSQVPSSAPSEANTNTTLGIIAGVVVLAAVIGVAVMVYLRGGFEGIGVKVVGAGGEAEHERKPRGRAAKKIQKRPDPGQRFCPQCGEAARPGDMFCRNCGTKLHG